jgi:branched-chain amino acid transport system substrate-binding protein
VYLAGLPGSNGGTLVKTLRARFGNQFPLIAPNPFTAVPFVYQQAGAAARGLYVTNSWIPVDQLAPRGRAFVRAFAAAQHGVPVFDSTSYEAAATEVLLAAIARSDGTRAGVSRALLSTRLSDGILGPVSFDRDGDRVEPPVPVLRLVRRRALPDAPRGGAVVDRVIVPPASATG